MGLTVNNFQTMKRNGEKISVLTAYDAAFARALEAAGVDVILVGDSLGNVVLGYEHSLPVTMEDMLHHAKAVCRTARQSFVIFDMPFMSYQVSVEEAVRNAGTAMKVTGCQAVKLEGGREFAPAVRAIVETGIPVCGHLGLTPQSVHRFGGYRVQGRDAAQAKRIMEDAKALEAAGAFMIVLECIPWKLAQKISKELSIPTIGIGAGPHCDGQVLVIHDMLNFTGRTPFKFVKVYMDFEKQLEKAVRSYVEDVRSGAFPTMDHSFQAETGVIENLDSGKSGRRRK